MAATSLRNSGRNKDNSCQIGRATFYEYYFALWVVFFALAASPLYGQQAAPQITTKLDDSARITLKGNTPPIANSKFDRGAVSDSYHQRQRANGEMCKISDWATSQRCD